MPMEHNRYEDCGDYYTIHMSGDKSCVISKESYDAVKPYTWCVEGTGYVMSKTGGKSVKMHRIITGAKKGQYVDHMDGNPRNNRIENLRLCTKQQNEFNSKIRSDNTSGYRGVCLYRNGKFRAYLTKDGKQYNLGCNFDTPEAAAKAYNSFAVKMYGEFARLNPVD